MTRAPRVVAVAALVVLATGCVALPGGGQPTAGPTTTAGSGDVARVTHVVDGDTVDVTFSDDREERVRLLGVDTPEVHGDVTPAEYAGVPDTPAGRACLREWGERASALADRRLDGRRVRVATDPAADERGTYGRLLAYVTVVGANESFNYRLVRTGHARVYVSSFGHLEAYRAAADRARDRNRGLWTCRTAS